MREIRLLSVTFDHAIQHYELPAFRSAVIEKVGRDHDLYHNHNNQHSGNNYHYRYPLVQYKLTNNLPSILYISEGVEDAHHFFTSPNWDLTFTRKNYKAKVLNFKPSLEQVGVDHNWYRYTLKNWQALNQKNYKTYKTKEGLIEKVSMLERCLAGHILGFATGIELQFNQRFELKITDMRPEKFLPCAGVKVVAFDIEFISNVRLPSLVGLGKGVRVGFGVSKRIGSIN